MQKERLRDEIVKAICRLDYFNLQKLSTFIDDLESIRLREKEYGGADHEDG